MYRRWSSSVLPAALLAAAAVAVVFTRSELGDYRLEPGPNNATPAIHDLAAGRLGAAFDALPAMGLLSVLLRVPAAFVAGSGDLLFAHRLGSLLCMVAVVSLAVALDRRMATAGRGTAYRLVLGLLLVAGPGILWAFDQGHPEEFLGGALCAGAVLAAVERRTVVAAVLLGLAIGTKQWALLAAVPTLMAIGKPQLLDRGRITAALTAALVAAVFVLPPILLAPTRFSQVSDALAKTERVYPESIWWPVSTESERRVELAPGDDLVVQNWRMPLGLDRGQATFIAVLLSLALIPLALRRGGLRDPLAALTALLTLRAALDPMNLDYYIAPAMLALATWEGVRGPPGGLPVVSLAAAGAALVVWGRGAGADPAVDWAIWAGGTLPLLAVVWLGRRAPQPPRGPSGAASPSRGSVP